MKHRSMFVAIGLVALVLATVACGQSAQPTATPGIVFGPQEPTPTPALQFGPVAPTLTEVAPETVSGLYDGTWLGITGQSIPITVTVKGDMVTSVAFDVMIIGQGWTATSEQYRPVASQIDDQGEVTVRFQDESWGVIFVGQFDGELLAGVLEVSHTHPQIGGTATTTTQFVATRMTEGQEV